MIDLTHVRPWCQTTRPLFICGLARSGTSMLYAMLARHPALFSLQRLGETFIFLKPRALLSDPAPDGLRAYLGSPEALALMRQCLAQADAAAGRPLTDLDVARLFFHVAAHRLFPGQRPLEKTPGHVQKLDLIFRAFPNAQVLVCVRDPVEIVASYRKRLHQARLDGVAPERLGWLDRTIDQKVRIFQRFAHAVETGLARHGAQMLLVPYRAVTEAPSLAMQRICEATGLTYDAALIAPLPIDALGFRGGPIEPRGADHAEWVHADEALAVREACGAWLPQWCAGTLPA